jgi:hypothetical protein
MEPSNTADSKKETRPIGVEQTLTSAITAAEAPTRAKDTAWLQHDLPGLPWASMTACAKRDRPKTQRRKKVATASVWVQADLPNIWPVQDLRPSACTTTGGPQA